MWYEAHPAEGREPLEFLENSAPQKRCPFEMALLALFWRIYWVYSGTIVVTGSYFFGDRKFSRGVRLLDHRYFNFKYC
jgi:hypothetical protein